jgi:hypothetical protein
MIATVPNIEELKATITVIEYLRGRAPQSRRVGREEVFPCILHPDGKRPNLRVNEEKNAWFCDVCDKGGGLIELVGYELFADGFSNRNPYHLQQVREFLSGASIAPTPPATPIRKAPKSTTKRPTRDVRTYDYTDADGTLLYQVVRREYTDQEGGKTFLQRRPDGKDRWHWNMTGIEPVLYHLSELRDETNLLFGCEGEEDVDEVRKYGLRATTNSGGAGKWTPAHSRELAGLDLVQLPDNDPAGEAHAEDVARMSYGIAKSVRIVRLPGLPPKGDVRDWFNAGGTVIELYRLVEATKAWTPTVERFVPQPPPVPVTATACEARLAAVTAELAAEKAKVQRLEVSRRELQRLNEGLIAVITNEGHDPAARVAQVVVLREYAKARENHKVRGQEERAPIVVEKLAPVMGMTRQAAGRWITRGAESGIWERHEGPRKESNGHDYRPLSIAPTVKGNLAEMLEAVAKTVDPKTAARGKYHPRRCPNRKCRSENIYREVRYVCRDCQTVFDETNEPANRPEPTVEQNVPEVDQAAATVERNVPQDKENTVERNVTQQPLRPWVKPEPVAGMIEFDPYKWPEHIAIGAG